MDEVIIVCGSCRQKNRVSLRAGAVCGRCKEPIEDEVNRAFLKIIAQDIEKEVRPELLV